MISTRDLKPSFRKVSPFPYPTGWLILPFADNLFIMGSYFRGDVLLAPLCISRERGMKVRPGGRPWSLGTERAFREPGIKHATL